MAELNQSDHDLLIELRTIVRGMSEDLKEIKEDHRARLVAVEQGKVDKVEAEKVLATFDTRITTVEHRQWLAMGGAGVIGALISYAIVIVSKLIL